MNTYQLYTLFKTIATDIDSLSSFYFIEMIDRNDEGKSEEYPKLILKKPLYSSNTDKYSKYSVVLEILDTFNETQDNIISSTEDEIILINNCENIAREIINKLKLSKPTYHIRDFNMITIHKDHIDFLSGVELSFDIIINNSLCEYIIPEEDD